MKYAMTNTRANLMYALAAFGFIFAVQTATILWVVLAALVHIVVISLFSAITHRYFCHRAFHTNRSFAWFLSAIPVCYGYASPISWAIMHASHHAFADTPDDPHINGWRGTFTAAYREPKIKLTKSIGWFSNARHRHLHEYAILYAVGLGLCLAAIDFTAFLWLYVVPVFTLRLGDGVHRSISHYKGAAMNRWYMEYVLPAGGEWIHDEHHKNASKPIYKNEWYEIDTGGLIIKAIRTKGEV